VQQNTEKKDFLSQVAEFCTAPAIANPAESSEAQTFVLSNDVRAEILELLWHVLTHTEATSLKSYEVLKRYATHDLRVEPEQSKHREKYIRSCLIRVLNENSKQHIGGSVVDTHAVKMVRLTNVVLFWMHVHVNKKPVWCLLLDELPS
jgi:hypothetical protein